MGEPDAGEREIRVETVDGAAAALNYVSQPAGRDDGRRLAKLLPDSVNHSICHERITEHDSAPKRVLRVIRDRGWRERQIHAGQAGSRVEESVGRGPQAGRDCPSDELSP